jgi:hypothetical protein
MKFWNNNKINMEMVMKLEITSQCQPPNPTAFLTTP